MAAKPKPSPPVDYHGPNWHREELIKEQKEDAKGAGPLIVLFCVVLLYGLWYRTNMDRTPPPSRDGWPATSSGPVPGDSLEEQIALGKNFFERLYYTSDRIHRRHSPLMDQIYRRNIGAERRRAVGPSLYVANDPAWPALAEWWDSRGRTWTDPHRKGNLARLGVGKLRARFENLAAAHGRITGYFPLSHYSLSEDEESELREIVKLIGRDGLLIPFDESTGKFLPNRELPENAPEVVLSRMFEMEQILTGRDPVNDPFKPVDLELPQ